MPLRFIDRILQDLSHAGDRPVLVDAVAVARLRDSLRPNVWVVDATPRGGFDLASLLTHLDR